jgi:hypothetical protein
MKTMRELFFFKKCASKARDAHLVLNVAANRTKYFFQTDVCAKWAAYDLMYEVDKMMRDWCLNPAGVFYIFLPDPEITLHQSRPIPMLLMVQ